jgi:HrpA-like RNA helicase
MHGKKLKYNENFEEYELLNSISSSFLPIDNYRNNLYNIAKELVYLMQNNDILLVMGETGSGKSTSIII